MLERRCVYIRFGVAAMLVYRIVGATKVASTIFQNVKNAMVKK